MSKHVFSLTGMNCSGCVNSARLDLEDVPGVINANPLLERKQVEIEGEFEGKSEAEIVTLLAAAIAERGFVLTALV